MGYYGVFNVDSVMHRWS